MPLYHLHESFPAEAAKKKTRLQNANVNIMQTQNFGNVLKIPPG